MLNYKLDTQELGRENSTFGHFEIQKQFSQRNLEELRVKYKSVVEDSAADGGHHLVT